MNNRNLILAAGISGALAVALGAFGSHGLKPHLTAESMEVWRTASHYHFIHTLAILLLGFASKRLQGTSLVAILFLSGIFLFSGSLYLISTTSFHGIPLKILGPLTPIGGVLFIFGWLALIKVGFDNITPS